MYEFKLAFKYLIPKKQMIIEDLKEAFEEIKKSQDRGGTDIFKRELISIDHAIKYLDN